jgi:ABC-type oligopeptide transport system substrate-binding subunit
MNLFRQADSLLVQEAAVVPLSYGRPHWLVKPWISNFPTSWINNIIELH